MKVRKKLLPFLYHAPIFVVLVIITLIPFFLALNLSLRDYSLFEKIHPFIGLENYRQLINEDPLLWAAIWRTLKVVAIAVSIELMLGIFIAFLLNQDIRAPKVFLGLLIIPMMLAPAVVGLIWRYLLNVEFGFVPFLIGRLGLPVGNDLLTPKTALFTIIAIDIWQWTPFITLLAFAGIRSVPREIEEAAQIEGTGALKTFWYITLPLAMPVIVIAIILRSIEIFKMFDKVYVLTRGGPGSATDLASLYTYRINFEHFDMGYGAATVLILFFIVLIWIDLFYFCTLRERR